MKEWGDNIPSAPCSVGGDQALHPQDIVYLLSWQASDPIPAWQGPPSDLLKDNDLAISSAFLPNF